MKRAIESPLQVAADIYKIRRVLNTERKHSSRSLADPLFLPQGGTISKTERAGPLRCNHY